MGTSSISDLQKTSHNILKPNMHLKSFLSLALIVVLVYLSSYASAATYNYNQQQRRQPQNINRFDQGVQNEKPPNGPPLEIPTNLQFIQQEMRKTMALLRLV